MTFEVVERPGRFWQLVCWECHDGGQRVLTASTYELAYRMGKAHTVNVHRSAGAPVPAPGGPRPPAG